MEWFEVLETADDCNKIPEVVNAGNFTKKNLYPQKNRYLSEFEIVLSKNSVKLQADLHVIFALMQLSMNGDVFVSRPEEAN